jgi:hypothetical protein
VNKLKITALKIMLLMLALVLTLIGCSTELTIQEVPAEDNYTYVNPEEVKAESDPNIVIDGVLDEDAYKNSNWLYLYNNDGGNNVSIAMTSWYGQKGMYFVFDVTESVPIYVNPDRPSYMNSCIELYLTPSYVSSMQDNGVFEIDLMPTGDMLFKRGNGKITSDGNIGYGNVASSNDIMARLAATPKGGAINSESCRGYCLEFFIPWDYMEWLGVDTATIKDGFVYINPAHITSYNLLGTDVKLDRFWYHYAQQNGAKFSNVTRYFRFNSEGVMGGTPVTLQQGEHYTISGATNILYGMNAYVTVTPDAGYGLTSVTVNGKEQIQNASFNPDGSITLKLTGTNENVTVSAQATATSAGVKTLSGKVVLKNIMKDTLDGLVLSYVGPNGEQPLVIDANGQFELKDVPQGQYVLKAEKAGYQSVTCSIFLNQDAYTELVLQYDYFQNVQGNCWILDDQNDGVLYKKEGNGQAASTVSYNNVTFWANLKYDSNLATQGTTDEHTQQRSGVQLRFSNGKNWHIDLLKQNGAYVLQYAKISGDKSLFGWKVVHTLTDEQVNKYTGKDGIKLMLKRNGNEVAIYLEDKLLVVETLGAEYKGYTVQVGVESWMANTTLVPITYGVSADAKIPTESKPIFYPANTWNTDFQNQGYVIKTGVAGQYTLLEAAVVANSITTTVVDLSPDTNDYCMIYVFKFSNGEQFWVRLHHTDKDGKYRIQTMTGSTVHAAWKSPYTLTDAEVQKVQGAGLDYRVQIVGTTAYVYLDGQQVCTFDLSKVVETGAASGIGSATVTVSLRLDGNIGRDTKVPFKLVQDTHVENPVPDVPVNTIFDIVKGKWDLNNQQNGVITILNKTTDASTVMTKESTYKEVSVTVKDYTPSKNADGSLKQGDFSMQISFIFDNGKQYQVRLHNTDADGNYKLQNMGGTNSITGWKWQADLTAAHKAKLLDGDGVQFTVKLVGANAELYVDGTKLATVALGAEYDGKLAQIQLCMNGNKNGQNIEIPFELK